jgi:two-component system, OmpR family, sensor histidine kinase ChvG
VAHELKNPLTSLRSAVETLPLVKSDEPRARLLAVIQHDVRRLDRLISDISDASRLDAELAKADIEPIDLAKLVQAVASLANDMRKPGDPEVRLTVMAKGENAKDAFMILGHDSRLGQVMTNLIDNARSFSPPGGAIDVILERTADGFEIRVDDEGPGVPEHAMERIFERFYTDRPPEQGFGQNSGLGLSISRQIVQAHRGTLTVSNRPPRDAAGVAAKTSGGASFQVRLPRSAGG